MAKVILEITADATGLTPATKEVNNLNKSFDTLENTIVDADGKVIKLSKSVAANNPEVVKLSKGFNDLNKTLASGAMKQGAKDLADLGKATVDTDKKTLSLKAQILELRKAAGQAAISMGELEAAGKAGSAEYQKLNKVYTDSIQKAARLKETQDDLSESVNRLANNKLEIALNGMVAAARLSAAGFGVAASTAALFGDESEELQRTMVKLQAVMTLVNSLQEIQQLLRKEDALNTARQTFLTGGLATAKSAEATATVASTAATQGATVATTGLAVAMNLLPIFAIITGIGLLIRYWDEVTDAIDGAEESTGNYGTAMEFLATTLIGALKPLLAIRDAIKLIDMAISGTDEAEKGLIGTMSELHKMFEDRIEYERTYRELKKGGLNDMQREIDLLEAMGASEVTLYTKRDALIKAQIANKQEEIDVSRKYYAMKTGEDEALLKKEDELRELQTERSILKIKYDAIILEQQKKLIETQEEQLKLTREAENKDIQERLRIIGEFYDLKLVGVEKVSRAELEILRQRYKAENDLINQNYVELGLTELQAQLRMAQNNQVLIDLEKDLTNKRIAERKRLEKSQTEQIDAATAHEKKAADEATQIQSQKYLAAIEIAAQTAQTIFSIEAQYRQANFDAEVTKLNDEKNVKLKNKALTDAQRDSINQQYAKKEAALKLKQFQADKRAALAMVLVNTAVAVAKLAAVFPPPLPAFFAGLPIIAATGALQTAAILATPTPAFAKGTKNAPPGFKWVGEEGPELINTPGNHAIITAPESAHLANIFEKYNLPGLQVPSFNAANVSSKVVNSAANFDYDAMGKSVAKHLPEGTKVNINMDKDGIHAYVVETNSRKTYMNNRFKFNA